MRIAHAPSQVERQPRAVCVGTFDGVHRGHRAVLDAAAATGLAVTVITFEPHPRIALGNQVALLTTLERRLELLGAGGVETTLVAAFTTEFQRLEPEEFAAEWLRGIGVEAVIAGEDFRFGSRRGGDLALLERLGFEIVPVPGVEGGVETTLVAAFTTEFQRLEPEEFAAEWLRGIGVEAVIAGEDFRFGSRRGGDLALLERLGFEIVPVPGVEGVSSTAIRAAVAEGDVVEAARLLGRPFELDGIVVAGDQRGGTLGFPTANLALGHDLACPRFGIYAGAALEHRAAVSIGTNPHYGGTERRIEPHLLDFDGDLYGQRLVVELWERLRDEAAFPSEEELLAQIGRDVAAARTAARPA